jgi:hypothetical protein
MHVRRLSTGGGTERTPHSWPTDLPFAAQFVSRAFGVLPSDLDSYAQL